jgi:very-short-patch-repair endonuclease
LLAVEIDGQTHDRGRDLLRDAALECGTGIQTVRFTNYEIMTNLEGAKIALLLALQARADRWTGRCSTTPQPPPLKRRGS